MGYIGKVVFFDKEQIFASFERGACSLFRIRAHRKLFICTYLCIEECLHGDLSVKFTSLCVFHAQGFLL